MIGTGKTVILNESIMSCDNIDDFREDIFSKISSQKELWVNKLAEIMQENNYSQADIARLCGVSRATVLKWVRGSLPQSREMFIKIGFAAHYDLKEMNRFLQRYGRYPALYPKTPEDSVYIFVLNSDTLEHTFENCEAIRSSIDTFLQVRKDSDGADYKTELVMNELNMLSKVEELREFVATNAGIFASSFKQFYDYVIDFVRKNNESYVDNNNPDNINMLAETLEWSSSLRKCVYSIYKNEWFPLRNKVISLGIHLNMNLDEINEMLHLAKMEPLYVINPLECILIYAVMDAELSDEIFDGTDDLYNHVIEVMEALGIDDGEFELCDLWQAGDNRS